MLTRVKLYDGPLHGKTVELASPGTLCIVLKGWVGRYNRTGVWEGIRL